jgi:hypothetical protein
MNSTTNNSHLFKRPNPLSRAAFKKRVSRSEASKRKAQGGACRITLAYMYKIVDLVVRKHKLKGRLCHADIKLRGVDGDFLYVIWTVEKKREEPRKPGIARKYLVTDLDARMPNILLVESKPVFCLREPDETNFPT